MLYRCESDRVAEPTPGRREITPGDVERAVRTIGLPRLKLNIQPSTETLVNVDTIFFAQPQTLTRTVSLLGYRVDLAAAPSSFTWHYGDGVSATTDQPGRPYPAKDVVHRYLRAAPAITPRVDVAYRVRYRVDGEAWRALESPIVATGNAAQLRVREAMGVLTGY